MRCLACIWTRIDEQKVYCQIIKCCCLKYYSWGGVACCFFFIVRIQRIQHNIYTKIMYRKFTCSTPSPFPSPSFHCSNISCRSFMGGQMECAGKHFAHRDKSLKCIYANYLFVGKWEKKRWREFYLACGREGSGGSAMAAYSQSWP